MKTINIVLRCFVVALILLVSASVAVADIVYWTDWTSESAAASSVTGTITTGSDTIGVTATGPYYFAQISGGTNYWIPSAPYLNSVVSNAPSTSDIIALGAGGTETITFSEAVHDPLLALVSWNANVAEFGRLIQILGYGQGWWGNGTPTLNAAGTGFTGTGEVHGVILIPGDFTSISFTHTSEYWHGFTVGILGPGEIPPPGVPEPATLLLLGSGLAGLSGFTWWHRRG